ncbi:MAG: phosphate ABC transporter ATP-binding protein [Akkermansiaceae bacterium]
MMEKPHIEFRNVTARYGNNIALDGLDFVIRPNTIFGIVGPANSGKTTLLKCINRTIDFIPSASIEGCVRVGETSDDGEITLEDVSKIKNVYSLRRRIGMVFPLPVGLPLSIYENVAYGPRRAGIHDKDTLDELVERCLKQSVLWDEVKDRLDSLGTKLSGGQQQRLTLARALSLEPEILCLDEFSIAIDPVTTMKIEDVLVQLKEKMTIILVTNLIQQAQRISDDMMFLNDSDIVELGPTAEMFANPKHALTGKYLAGEMG